MMGRASFRRLASDNRGAAVVELALAAPVLAMMVIGIVDISNAYSRKMALEQGAQRAIEKIMQTTEITTPDSTIQQEAADQADVETSQVTVGYQKFCDGEPEEYNTDCDEGQKKANYISVTVVDTYEPMFPVHLAGIDEDGTYHLKAVAGMRTQ